MKQPDREEEEPLGRPPDRGSGSRISDSRPGPSGLSVSRVSVEGQKRLERGEAVAVIVEISDASAAASALAGDSGLAGLLELLPDALPGPVARGRVTLAQAKRLRSLPWVKSIEEDAAVGPHDLTHRASTGNPEVPGA